MDRSLNLVNRNKTDMINFVCLNFEALLEELEESSDIPMALHFEAISDSAILCVC